MNEEFDYKGYATELQNFISNMGGVKNEKSMEIVEYIKPISKILGIGYLETTWYESEKDEKLGAGKKAAFYKSEDSGDTVVYSHREVMADGNVVLFDIYPVGDVTKWSEDEISRADAFVKLLVMFSGNAMGRKLIEYRKFHESDFGMYNSAYFVSKTVEYMRNHTIEDFGVCQFNVKRMSYINKEFGMKWGTRLLKRYVDGVQELLTGEGELMSRLGGDNFVVFFRKENEEKIIEYLKGVVIEEKAVSDSEIWFSAWIGIYLPKGDIRNPADVVECAVFATNRAKNTGSREPVYYDEKLLEEYAETERIQMSFMDALQKEEFQVYYQPKINLQDYQLEGAEALCRWIHNGEMIMPNRFIPIFERNRRICMLDFYVLDHVCRDIRRWIDEGRNIVRVSVNLSRGHFSDGKLLEHILEIIDRNNVPHEYIEIELTETSTDVDFGKLKSLVVELKKQGIHTAVDDFGCGYSSLSLIREIPWDVIKLDKSFIDMNENDDGRARMIYGHVIAMAREMGLECITEGVETIEQVNVLKDNNCYVAQGFYFDRPMPVTDFEKRLSECKYD